MAASSLLVVCNDVVQATNDKQQIVPMLGKLASEPEAYTYLPSSVKRFPGPQPLGAEAVGDGQPGRVVGQNDVDVPQVAGGLGHLTDGRSAVAPI